MADRAYAQEEIDAEIAAMEANWKMILDWTGAALQPDGSYHKRHPHGLASLRLACDSAGFSPAEIGPREGR
jgi:transketolase C-terminal domain/subunit